MSRYLEVSGKVLFDKIIRWSAISYTDPRPSGLRAVSGTYALRYTLHALQHVCTTASLLRASSTRGNSGVVVVVVGQRAGRASPHPHRGRCVHLLHRRYVAELHQDHPRIGHQLQPLSDRRPDAYLPRRDPRAPSRGSVRHRRLPGVECQPPPRRWRRRAPDQEAGGRGREPRGRDVCGRGRAGEQEGALLARAVHGTIIVRFPSSPCLCRRLSRPRSPGGRCQRRPYLSYVEWPVAP